MFPIPFNMESTTSLIFIPNQLLISNEPCIIDVLVNNKSLNRILIYLAPGQTTFDFICTYSQIKGIQICQILQNIFAPLQILPRYFCPIAPQLLVFALLLSSLVFKAAIQFMHNPIFKEVLLFPTT